MATSLRSKIEIQRVRLFKDKIAELEGTKTESERESNQAMLLDKIADLEALVAELKSNKAEPKSEPKAVVAAKEDMQEVQSHETEFKQPKSVKMVPSKRRKK